MVTLHDRYNDPLKEARDALSTLPRDAEKAWHRRYDMRLKPVVPRADTQPAGFFTPLPPPAEPLPDPRTPEVFARVERAQEIGGKRLADELSARLPLRRRLALVVAGFAPDALLSDDSSEAGSSFTAVGRATGAVAAAVTVAWRELVGLGQ